MRRFARERKPASRAVKIYRAKQIAWAIGNLLVFAAIACVVTLVLPNADISIDGGTAAGVGAVSAVLIAALTYILLMRAQWNVLARDCDVEGYAHLAGIGAGAYADLADYRTESAATLDFYRGAFERVVTIEPWLRRGNGVRNPRLLAMYACACWEQNSPAGIEWALDAFARIPHSSHIRYRCGYALMTWAVRMREGNARGASEALDGLNLPSSRRADNCVIAYCRARAHAAFGDEASAKEAYREAARGGDLYVAAYARRMLEAEIDEGKTL